MYRTSTFTSCSVFFWEEDNQRKHGLIFMNHATEAGIWWFSWKKETSLPLHHRPSSGKLVKKQGNQKQFFETCDYDLQMLNKSLLARTQTYNVLGQSMCLPNGLSFTDWKKIAVSILKLICMVKMLTRFVSIMYHFVVEERQKNWEYYSPKMLLQLYSNLQFWALGHNPNAHCFRERKYHLFWPFHIVLDNTEKNLLSSTEGHQPGARYMCKNIYLKLQ